MRRVLRIVLGLSAGLASVSMPAAGAATCDGRFYFQLCDYASEVAASAEPVAKPEPKPRPVKRRRVVTTKLEDRLPQTEPPVVEIGVPVALELSLQLTPPPVPEVMGETPACMLERAFNDLRISAGPRTLQQLSTTSPENDHEPASARQMFSAADTNILE